VGGPAGAPEFARGGIFEPMPDDPNPRNPSPPPSKPAAPSPAKSEDLCEVCGSDQVSWRNCKLLCANCKSIVKSCADL
jgi:hypothetical protein